MVDQNIAGAEVLEAGRNAFSFLAEFGWVIVLGIIILVVLFIYLNRKKEKFRGEKPKTHFKAETERKTKAKLSKSDFIGEKDTDESFSFEGKTLSKKDREQVEELTTLMREKAVKLSRIEMVHAIVNLGFEPRIAEEVVKRLYRK